MTDFADLYDFAGIVRITLRLLIAGVLGGLLGYQREHLGKSAGLRTHTLVALGAAIYTMTPQLAGASPNDMTRVVQGIVVGIGFLGAGAIAKDQKTGEIHNLTTAAGIWATAAIGMTAGMGREVTAIVSTLLALAVLQFVPHTKNGRRSAITRYAEPIEKAVPPEETKLL